MTICFAAILSAVVEERVDAKAGAMLLRPLAHADTARINRIAAAITLGRPGESKIVFDHSVGSDRHPA